MKTTVLFFCFFLIIAYIGCGHNAGESYESNRTPVMGTVTLDGKPLIGGSVTFVSVENPRYRVTTPIRSSGEFSVADAPLGQVRMTVETESLRTGNPKQYIPIPRKYRTLDSSGLTATITKNNANPLRLELSSN